MRIDHVDLAGIDLNLLVALDALLSEQSVTRAAAKIGIGQSAMSSSLARLRILFSDELLARTPKGMRATPRALTLAEPLRAALKQIQAIIRVDEAFDPMTLERTFRVALPDSLEILMMPQVLAELSTAAPGVRLELRPFHLTGVLDDLDADRIDIGLGPLFGGNLNHKQRLLFTESFVCMFNAELLGVTAPLSLDDYVRFPHVLTTMTDTSKGVVDDALARAGLTRKLMVRTPSFLAVPYLVKTAPVMTTMVKKLATIFSAAHGLTISPPPVELEEITIRMIWHSSYDAEPAHRWLRDLFFKHSRRL